MTTLSAELLKRALQNAILCDGSQLDLRHLHSARSSAWVACLAEELRAICSSSEIVVFTKYDERNRDRFGLNELLYDICICETATLGSPGRGKVLHYVSRALWQVESEFAEGDSTEWVKDFNKLVIGNAANKLFIGPVMRRDSLDALLPVAQCCSGQVFAAMVPHPSKWQPASSLDVSLWTLEAYSWRQL